MRGARYVHLIPWTLHSGSEHLHLILHFLAQFRPNSRLGQSRLSSALCGGEVPPPPCNIGIQEVGMYCTYTAPYTQYIGILGRLI
jgi:hypothetical protein